MKTVCRSEVPAEVSRELQLPLLCLTAGIALLSFTCLIKNILHKIYGLILIYTLFT